MQSIHNNINPPFFRSFPSYLYYILSIHYHGKSFFPHSLIMTKPFYRILIHSITHTSIFIAFPTYILILFTFKSSIPTDTTQAIHYFCLLPLMLLNIQYPYRRLGMVIPSYPLNFAASFSSDL